jgi:hypothetical protein
VTADREQRGTAWRTAVDRKKVERAATRRSEVDDIRKVGGRRGVAGIGSYGRLELRFLALSGEVFMRDL